MPAAVKIKAGKYGSAIGLLLERGGAFQTRHERTLIVTLADKFRERLDGLSHAIPEDLRLPSLDENRLM